MISWLVRSLILACLLIGMPASHAAAASLPSSLASPQAPLPPIVIVPGAPGTELVDRATGKRVWPDPWLMVYPMDGNDRLALPLDDPESSPVVSGGLLREVSFLGVRLFRIHAYDGLEARLREMGYRPGSWEAPAGAGELYYFPYDWRQSVETSGRRFSRELEDLYRRMPPGTPPAVVIGHSLGGLVARYALMYGDTPLGETGPLPPVTWAGGSRIGALFLVATPNEGTFTALKCLDRGSFYRFRHGAFSPATLFTFPSMFDMLPERIEPLVDGNGKALPFRLDDPADWERLGWSVIGQSGRRRGSAVPHPVLRAHLERELARHARLQAALSQIAGAPNPAALYVVGSLSQSVQRTAVVLRRGGRIRVRFEPPDGGRRDLASLMFEPGDTMVPDRSLTAAGSAHDPASSLFFRSVRHSTRSHQDLLSSPEMLAALGEVLQQPAQDRAAVNPPSSERPAPAAASQPLTPETHETAEACSSDLRDLWYHVPVCRAVSAGSPL
jgi:pimeloyl-ACP methyl ester carboxylesterase